MPPDISPNYPDIPDDVKQGWGDTGEQETPAPTESSADRFKRLADSRPWAINTKKESPSDIIEASGKAVETHTTSPLKPINPLERPDDAHGRKVAAASRTYATAERIKLLKNIENYKQELESQQRKLTEEEIQTLVTTYKESLVKAYSADRRSRMQESDTRYTQKKQAKFLEENKTMTELTPTNTQKLPETGLSTSLATLQKKYEDKILPINSSIETLRERYINQTISEEDENLYFLLFDKKVKIAGELFRTKQVIKRLEDKTGQPKEPITQIQREKVWSNTLGEMPKTLVDGSAGEYGSGSAMRNLFNPSDIPTTPVETPPITRDFASQIIV